MQGFWGIVIVAGFGAAAVAELLAACLCFSLGPGKGLASLFVPGYLFVGIRRHAYYWRVIGLWLCGLVAITAGTVALS
jgi:hypothetical protein